MAIYPSEFGLICLPLHKKYKSHIEIIALMLDALKDNGGSDRYPIMKRTGINYAQLKKYLESLSKMGFIEISVKQGNILYKTSEKGLAFLNQYNILRDMLLGACFPNKTTNNNVYDMQQHGPMPLTTRLARRP